MKRLALLLFAAVPLFATGCGEQAATTSVFLDEAGVTAVAGLDAGGIEFASADGTIWQTDAEGKKADAPLGKAPILGTKDARNYGVLALAIDTENRTFASWVQANGTIAVGQVAPGATRIIWEGPNAVGAEAGATGGDISFTPSDRVLVSLGGDVAPAGSNLLTLDPNQSAPQQPNLLTGAEANPTSVLYDQSGTLWIARGTEEKGDSVFDRLSTNGSVGFSTTVKGGGPVVGFTKYGEQELAACMGTTKKLTRFLINDRTIVPGRTSAADCTGDITQAKDGRIVYVTPGQLRITA